ncbi:nuclear transport factor 2 family protein [Leeuwenhoekiella sp. MAR_2009_132]|uniref:nuclear transport factor 2 family protein n=1 Tax=Leeuwenhoekiella sp. MAR_2009_132 TaxID=1392489 RepID=UPI00048FDB52|nr:nuclear transport factor 2 family protein [Leeuwenhoekiella sp. MAR_2009_132]
MKNIYKIVGFFMLLFTQVGFTQDSDVTKQVKELSMNKWQWMADKDVDKLKDLFDEDARFVHMSGSWDKSRELEIIESGSIWYKQANVHDTVVKEFGETVIVWNRITLVAHVRGDDVSTEFTVTEVYQMQNDAWKLLDLTFSSVRDTHKIVH